VEQEATELANQQGGGDNIGRCHKIMEKAGLMNRQGRGEESGGHERGKRHVLNNPLPDSVRMNKKGQE